jgi:hypothetical protein
VALHVRAWSSGLILESCILHRHVETGAGTAPSALENTLNNWHAADTLASGCQIVSGPSSTRVWKASRRRTIGLLWAISAFALPRRSRLIHSSAGRSCSKSREAQHARSSDQLRGYRSDTFLDASHRKLKTRSYNFIYGSDIFFMR